MKLKILNIDGKEKGSMNAPEQFSEPIRDDVIKRAVDAINTHNRQPYGAMQDAGERASAKISRRRRDYKTSYGHGISRVPRKIMSHRGTRFNWVAAFAPGTVGGRRSHPPKSEKIWDRKVNAKENRMAIRSALAACFSREKVMNNGHPVPESYPFILDDAIENVVKTKDLVSILHNIGFGNELARTNVRKIRAGKGKMRGRKYVTKTGALFITSNNSKLINAVANISGFECIVVNNINARILAPSSVGGRPVIFSESAINKLGKEKLFTEERIIPTDKNNDKNAKTEAKKAQTVQQPKEDKKAAKTVKPQPKQTKTA